MEKKPITTGDLRTLLAETMFRVSEGDVPQETVRSLVRLSNQITASISVEIKKQIADARLGNAVDEMGGLSVGRR